MRELKNTMLLVLLIMAVLYFAAKRHNEFLERCLAKGKSFVACWDLLR